MAWESTIVHHKIVIHHRCSSQHLICKGIGWKCVLESNNRIWYPGYYMCDNICLQLVQVLCWIDRLRTSEYLVLTLCFSHPRSIHLALQLLPRMYLTTSNMSKAIPNSQTVRHNNMWIIYKILKIKMHETKKKKINLIYNHNFQ